MNTGLTLKFLSAFQQVKKRMYGWILWHKDSGFKMGGDKKGLFLFENSLLSKSYSTM